MMASVEMGLDDAWDELLERRVLERLGVVRWWTGSKPGPEQELGGGSQHPSMTC